MLNDLRYAIRMLLKSPGFTAVAVVTLALGIGANTAIFSVVNSVLLRSLPFREADRLVVLWGENPHRGWSRNPLSPAELVEYKQSHLFADMAVFRSMAFNLTGSGVPEQLRGQQVTANLFSLLGVAPELGRTFLPEEDRPGSARVCILSYGLWQRRFGGDPGTIGKQISLSGDSYTVVGIMPASFSPHYTSFFWAGADLWIAGLNLSPTDWNNSYLTIARLGSGVALKQVQAQVDTVARRIEQQYRNTGWGVGLVGLQDEVVGFTRPVLLLLFGAVTFVLLIACANLANLLFARGASREREFAIRAALGATRTRLIRQLLAENVLLSTLGGGLGVLLAALGTKALVGLSPAILFKLAPGLDSSGINARVLVYTFVIAVGTGLLFGLAPALGSSKSDLNESLKEGGRSSTEGLRGPRLRHLLVTCEFALALVLLAGAGLMTKTLLALGHLDLGFNPKNVLTLRVPLFGSRYQDPEQRVGFFRELLARIEALPGVQSASISRGLPISGWSGQPFVTQENPNPPPGEVPAANYVVIGPQYFRTMEIPLRKGRPFTKGDTQASQRVAIVSEKLAHEHWPGQNAIGKHLKMGSGESKEPWLSVVGIAGNVLSQGPTSGFHAEVYVPYTQYPWWIEPEHLVVRLAANPTAVMTVIRREVAQLDKDQPVSEITTLDQIAGEPVALQRMLMVLLGAFAGLALVLAAVGAYSVTSFSVAQRTHEIGLRMALGAQEGDVLRMVIAKGIRPAITGTAIGLAGAFGLVRLLSSQLFGVKPVDPATFVSVALLLMSIASLASYIPARRATKVDPMVALRYE